MVIKISSKFLNTVLVVYMIVSLCSFCFAFGVKFALIYKHNTENGILSEGKIIKDIAECKNLSLEDASYCLRDWISGFYNYTVRDDTQKTLDDIVANGGDCFDYSNVYLSAARQLGFNSTMVSIFADYNSGHSITLIYDTTGYCLVDQRLTPKCGYYGIINKTVEENG